MITDYDSLLRVAEDGNIWWWIKDTFRLGADFLPVCDDHQTLEPELRATSSRGNPLIFS